MILARIQAHPSRAHLHGPLAKALAPLPVELRVHASEPPNPWENYLSCLSNLPDCSHVLIVQDDVIPCANFVPALEAVAASNPEAPVCLFLGGLPAATAARARKAITKRERFIPLGPSSFVPLVAVLWPRKVAQMFAFWARERRLTRADDGNAARWARQTKAQFMVAVPSLVQHDDSEPSVKGGRSHVPWKESWRQALFLSEDGSEFLEGVMP